MEHLFLYWELFAESFETGCFVAWLLAHVGVLVVARDQIFLGAAVSQASTLGIAIALALGAAVAGESWMQSPHFSTAMAVVFSVMAALVTSRISSRESPEAVTGWVFLVAGSLGILIVADSPHGQEEVHNLLFSSIVVAQRTDVWIFGVLAIATSVVVFLFRDRLLLFTIDPAMATAVGMRMSIWSLVTATWLGITVGLAISSSGLLFTFGCLVLPPLVAKNILRELRPMLLVAPIVAVVATAVSFLLADHFGYPPGQLTVVVLGLLVALSWFVSSWRRGRRV